MNKLILWIVALGFLFSPATRAQTSGEQREAEDYIRQSESEWAESVATGDVTAIERILAEDFVGIDPKGKQYSKKEMISETRDAPKSFVSNHLDEVKIRFYGNTAVAQGSESWVKKNGQRGRFVWTDTWLFRDGRWQIVAAEDLIAEPLAEIKK
jgi:ketosteroid isomerase-like protein